MERSVAVFFALLPFCVLLTSCYIYTLINISTPSQKNEQIYSHRFRPFFN